MNRRHILHSLLAAPFVIVTPGLLMPVRRVEAAPLRFGLDPRPAGTVRTIWFNNCVTLKHDLTKFILPGAADIVTDPGLSSARFVSLGDGNWLCSEYNKWTPVVPRLPSGG